MKLALISEGQWLVLLIVARWLPKGQLVVVLDAPGAWTWR